MLGREEYEQDPRGEEGGRESDFTQDDEFGLRPRLWYLLMLMRRGDAGRRPGERRAGGFQGQGRVLRLLSLHSPIAQKELAYLLGIRSQSLAEQVGKLEEAGLVQRHPNPQDRRTSVVELTDKGREVVEVESEDPETDPFDVLSEEEKRQFADLLDRVIGSIESNFPEGPDPRMQMFKQRAFGLGGEARMPNFGGFGGRFGGGFGPGGRPHGHGRRGW